MPANPNQDPAFTQWLEEWKDRSKNDLEKDFRVYFSELIQKSDFIFLNQEEDLQKEGGLQRIWCLVINCKTYETGFNLSHRHIKPSDDFISVKSSHLEFNLASNFEGKKILIRKVFTSKNELNEQLKEAAKHMFNAQTELTNLSNFISQNYLSVFLSICMQLLDHQDHKDLEKYRISDLYTKMDLFMTTQMHYTSQDVAKSIGVSIQYANRIFREIKGMPLKEYSTAKRLERARHLLITTKYSSSEISNQCGFKTTEYFNKNFRRRFNYPPMKYRKLSTKEGLTAEEKIDLHETTGLKPLIPLEEYEDMLSGPEQKNKLYFLIANTLNEMIHVYWVDENDKHILLSKASPDERVIYGSSKDQCWIIKDEKDNIISAYMTEPHLSIAIISELVDRRIAEPES